MIAAWMAYSMLVGACLLLAARAAEWGLERARVAGRWAWVAAAAAAIALPAARLLARGETESAMGARQDATSVLRLPPLVVRAASPLRAPAVDSALLGGWALLSLALAARWIIGHRRLQRRRRSWSVGTIEQCPVLVSESFGPAVVGVRRATVVVPAWLLTCPAAERALVLRHEREHVRAGDSALQLAMQLLILLFPWNAALHYIARRLRGAIEVDCDRRVLRGGVVDARRYGALLLQVAGRGYGSPPWIPALSESRAQLQRRILAMTHPTRIAPLPLLASASLAAVALLAACSADAPPAVQAGRDVPVATRDADVASASRDSQSGEPMYFEYQVQEPVQARSSSGAPKFPDVLRKAGVEGEVLVQFVVDTSGLPEMDSFKVLKESHELFGLAVKAALPGMRYSPARKDGKLVRQLVQQPFAFATAAAPSPAR